MRGNVTSDGINNYTWNAESETKTVAGVTYTYDGLGNRVEKSNGTLYWYGPSGEILEETGLTGALKNDYVFFDGERIARKDSSGNDFYYVEDHLGSSRAITTANGVLCSDADFLPYGQEVDYTSGCAQNYKFEGKERDTETGNDNFGARYYRSLVGRWLSPDWSAIPAPVPYADLTNPQTLNLYAMTRDNPETFADLDGHVGTGENGRSTGQSAQPTTTTCATQPSSGSNTSSCTTSKASNAAQQQSTVTIEYVKGQDLNPAGHSAISVNGQQAVGLEQKKDSVAAALEDKTTPGAVNAVDPNRTIKDRAVIAVTPEQAAKIQAFLNNAKQNAPNYNLYHSNCAQFCESALKAGGVKYVPNDLTPRGLVKDLKGTSIVDYIRMIPLPPIP